jgi:hypothetical protein
VKRKLVCNLLEEDLGTWEVSAANVLHPTKMLPKMSEEKTSSDVPVTFVPTQNEVQTPAAPPSKSYRKYVIIAVTGIVVAAIILAAILVGMYFFTEAQKEILKFSYNRNENTKEEVTSDPNTNIIQFHVSSPDQELWVVDDFNRDIQVMKVQTDSGTDCFVSPLNRTLAPDPSTISAPSNSQTMKRNATYFVSYQAAETPIPDSSFLCKAAKDLCKGISTYWVYPRCEAQTEDPAQRRKRSFACIKTCMSSCWWFFCSENCKLKCKY